MKVTYLKKPVPYRLPNNVVDLNAYRNARLQPALPAPQLMEVPVPHRQETPFRRFMDLLDAMVSVSLVVAALAVVGTAVL